MKMSLEEFNKNDELEFENDEEAGSSSENEGSDSMQRGKRPSKYVEFKIAVKHFSLPYFHPVSLN